MGLWQLFQRKPKTAPAAAFTPAGRAVAPTGERGGSTAPVAAARERSAAGSTAGVSGTLVRRIVTEKATGGSARGQYTFAVAPEANKPMVRQAIQQRYGARPVAVRLANQRGRRVRFGLRWGTTKAWKKAVVTLPPGAKIEGEKAAT